MKNIILCLVLLASPSWLLGQNEILVMLVDPDDKEMLEALGQDELPTQPQNETELEEYLRTNRLPMNERHARLARLSFQRQQRVIQLLDQMIEAPFHPADPERYDAFVKIVDEIVLLLFRAPTERDFYDIIFVTNQTWQNHLTEVERFGYLDKRINEENRARELRRQKIRKVITGVTALGGAALGAFGGYTMAQKVVPIAAEEKTLSLFLKWGMGRIPMILVGAGVGASVGSYLGFLGSNWLLWRQYVYIDPIDGNEDLRDILDVIDELP